MRLRDEVTRLRAAQRGQPRPEAAVPQTADQAPENQQVTIEAKFTELPASTLKKIAVEAIGLDVSGAGVTAILTDEQAKALVRAFEQQSGVDILATPSVTTLHNRQASVEIVDTNDVADRGAKMGPSLDVLPVVSADRRAISLVTTARLGDLAPVQDEAGAEQRKVRQTAVAGNCVMQDGQTVVLCQWLGRSDSGAATTPVQDPTCLVVLVTPTLIDPAGNRIHPVEEIAGKDAVTGAAESARVVPNRPVNTIAP